MITFGKRNCFGVQLEWRYDPLIARPWMYGIFQVLICGESLGSSTEEVTLNAILSELKGWKVGVAKRSRHRPSLMETDPVVTFLSIENERFGLKHLQHLVPPTFEPLPIATPGNLHVFDVDGLELVYRIYCVEDETTSRLLYCRKWEQVKECRIPRKIFNDVMFRTIDQLEEWFSQLPEDPARPEQV